MIIEKIREVSDFYGEKSTEFNFKMIEESNAIWEELVKIHEDIKKALEIFKADPNIVGSNAWYNLNPKSYESIDMEGFYHLQTAYIISVIDEATASYLLDKHIKNFNNRNGS